MWGRCDSKAPSLTVMPVGFPPRLTERFERQWLAKLRQKDGSAQLACGPPTTAAFVCSITPYHILDLRDFVFSLQKTLIIELKDADPPWLVRRARYVGGPTLLRPQGGTSDSSNCTSSRAGSVAGRRSGKRERSSATSLGRSLPCASRTIATNWPTRRS